MDLKFKHIETYSGFGLSISFQRCANKNTHSNLITPNEKKFQVHKNCPKVDRRDTHHQRQQLATVEWRIQVDKRTPIHLVGYGSILLSTIKNVYIKRNIENYIFTNMIIRIYIYIHHHINCFHPKFVETNELHVFVGRQETRSSLTGCGNDINFPVRSSVTSTRWPSLLWSG